MHSVKTQFYDFEPVDNIVATQNLGCGPQLVEFLK